MPIKEVSNENEKKKISATGEGDNSFTRMIDCFT
jgi:hypothetical protein